MEDNEAMLCAYIEGDLDAAGRAQIEKLLQDNPQHRKLLAELTAMRDLVRALPHVKAPTDLGDSLRQKAERSMLLDGPGAVVPERQSVSRWPQFFAIAAIFLLFASLCFILYKALGPTLKPATFTQNLAENKFLNMEPTSAVSEPASPPGPAPTELAAAPPAATPPAPARPAEAQAQSAEGTMQKAQTLQDQSRPQVAAANQLDLGAIRRRLESSGYGVDGQRGRMGGGNSAPVLMVVNSTDARATNVQISQFLNKSAGISWNVIPEDMEALANATTAPGGGGFGGGGGAAGGQSRAAVNYLEASSNGAADTTNATTRPSSDVFYVARGLTAEQADALRQTLTVPQNGAEVQVTVESAQPLMQLLRKSDQQAQPLLQPGQAATEPSTPTGKDDKALGPDVVPAAAASQPSAYANVMTDRLASPTTAPAAGSSLYGAPANAGMSVNRPQELQSVDTVIVLEQSQTSVLTAAATTRADTIATKSELAPATQPATQP